MSIQTKVLHVSSVSKLFGNNCLSEAYQDLNEGLNKLYNKQKRIKSLSVYFVATKYAIIIYLLSQAVKKDWQEVSILKVKIK